MAQFQYRVIIEHKDGNISDVGLFTIERPDEEYDSFTEAQAWQELKARAELGYSVGNGVLEFAGVVVALSDLARIRCALESKWREAP